MRFIEILFEDFKTAAKIYNDKGTSLDRIREIFAKYRELRPKMQPPENNIDWWAKNRNFRNLEDFLKNFEGIPTKSQLGKTVGRSKNIIENNDWLIVIPLDKDASCFHGKTTDWCTTKPFQAYYESYFYGSDITLIYCIQKKTGGKWAIAAHKRKLEDSEYFDVNDKDISKSEFEKQTGLSIDKILSIAFGEDVQTEVENSREEYRENMKTLRKLISNMGNERSSEIEKLIWKTKDKNSLQIYLSKTGPTKYNKNIEILAVNMVENAILYIENPSESLQLISASKDGHVTLSHLLEKYGEENISDAVKLRCLKHNGFVLAFVKNPTYEMIESAIKSHPTAIRFVKNPNENIKELAVSTAFSAIEYITNPSEKIQLIAAKQNGYALVYILSKDIDPSPQVLEECMKHYNSHSLIEAVLRNYNEKKYLLTEQIINIAIENTEDPKYLFNVLSKYDFEINDKQQLMFIKNNPNTLSILIFTYDNISDEILIETARQNGSIFVDTLYRYFTINNNTKIVIPSEAISEAIKSSGNVIIKVLDRLIRIYKYGIELNVEHFKDAIDVGLTYESNSDIISVLEKTISYPPVGEKDLNILIDYVADIVEKDNNKMLGIMLNDFKEEYINELENLTFEPETRIP
jgi:hypothetical protein